MPDARLDLVPLIDPIDREAVARYREQAVARGTPAGAPRWLVVALAIAAAVVVVLVASLVGRGSGGVLLIVLVGLGVFAVAGVASGALAPSPWRRWALLDRFARANGMAFTPRPAERAERGMIFGRGHTRITSELMELGDGWLDGRVATANHRYSITSGSGKNRRTRVYRWAYLVIQLDRHLPQLVLDAVQNDHRVLGLGTSDLPASFASAQRLGLEGDFDRWFRLYAPEGYERDALYVLTPDLMVLLIDQAGGGAALDVEIVDDRVYFYAPGHLDFTDPAVWQRLTGIVRTVGAKTLRQTVRYADERVGDRALDVVAPQGRRLRRGGIGGAVALVVGGAVLWVLVTTLFGR